MSRVLGFSIVAFIAVTSNMSFGATLKARVVGPIGLNQERATGVVVPANRTLDVSPVAAGISASRRLALPGATNHYTVKARKKTGSPKTNQARIEGVDPVVGASTTLVGRAQRTLAPNFGPEGVTLPLRTPANVPPRFRGRPLHIANTVTDATSGTPLDTDVAQFTIR